MAFYGRANRIFLESELLSGSLTDSQVAECDLDGLRVIGSHWKSTNMSDLNASDSSFTGCDFDSSTFERINMQGISITACAFSGMCLSGLTLIKATWNDVAFNGSVIKYCSLQRAAFSRLHAFGSTFSEFEALSARIDRSAFLGCAFEICYGNGMNGFSGAEISNTIFCDCRFSGFPFRGARLENCAFIRCRGEIGDDMECHNIAGLPRLAEAEPRRIGNRAAARELLEKYGLREVS